MLTEVRGLVTREHPLALESHENANREPAGRANSLNAHRPGVHSGQNACPA